MNATKYETSATIYFQGMNIMDIDLGHFDTMEAARAAAYKHMKTVDLLEDDAEVEYDIFEIINYGTDAEDGRTISTISLSSDEETGKEIISTSENISKEGCRKIIIGLPNYKVFVQHGAADCQSHEIAAKDIDNYINKSFFLNMTIDDDKKEIHIQNTTYAEMQV